MLFSPWNKHEIDLLVFVLPIYAWLGFLFPKTGLTSWLIVNILFCHKSVFITLVICSVLFIFVWHLLLFSNFHSLIVLMILLCRDGGCYHANWLSRTLCLWLMPVEMGFFFVLLLLGCLCSFVFPDTQGTIFSSYGTQRTRKSYMLCKS